jgi:DNA repair exonuclease SbcCD ATPase subunit
MADEEKQDPNELFSPEYRNFKMIERLTQQVDKINQATQAKMDFIVEQQAHFTANIQGHDERLNRLENIVTRLAELTANSVENINSQFAVLTDAHIRLEEAQRRTEEAQRRTEEAFVRLAESQAHTDKRLDALIDIVREGRNGKS